MRATVSATVRVIGTTAYVFAIARAALLSLRFHGMHLNLVLAAGLLFVQTLSPAARKALLEARESVWRSFFSNDRQALEKLIPEETIVMDPGSAEFGNRASVLEDAAQFAKSGMKLVRLEFPKTEIQRFGSVAVVYSTYFYELEDHGKRTPYSGRISEVFVLRNGHWVNPGWHMEPAREGQ
jgi:hypothetical protein